MKLDITELRMTINLIRKQNADYNYKEYRICSQENIDELKQYLIYDVPLEARARLEKNARRMRNFYDRLLYVKIRTWDKAEYNTYVYRLGDVVLYIKPCGCKDESYTDDFGEFIYKIVPYYEVNIGLWGYFIGQEFHKLISISTLDEIQIFKCEK